MERYHKHGFDPKTDKCRYLPKGEIANEDCPDSGRYNPLSDILIPTFDEASKLVAEDSSAQFKEGWNSYVAKPTGGNVEAIVKKCSSVLSDLKNRFGFEPKLDMIIPVKFKFLQDEMGVSVPCGMSELDHQGTKKSKMAIGTAFPIWNGYTYGHENLSQYIEDCIRHEIGHCCTTEDATSEYWEAVKFFEDMSKVPKERFVKEMTSEYAATHRIEEQIAELFSRVTSPDYKAGEVPELFESFVVNVLLEEGVR